MVLRAGTAVLLGLVFIAGCGPDRARVRPQPPAAFENLSYRAAQEKYRQRMEERYEQQDLSYLISVLDYGLTGFHARDRVAARQAFTAAYRVDQGDIPEAVRFFNWLQEDARKVYRLNKRERLLVHYYLGLSFLFEGNLQAATVEFKKLRLRDMEASRLPAVNFWYGLVCELSGEYDNALIEYRALAAMTGPDAFPAAAGLLARAESLAAGRPPPVGDSLELIVQVDHISPGSVGPVEIRADGEPVARLPGPADRFAVQLTGEEAARQAAQEASAELARQSFRLLGRALSQALLRDSRAGDLAADLAFGGSDDREDERYWGYAPVGFSVGRFRIPARTREVRLDFYGPGGRLGSCRYPLEGEHARVDRVGSLVFVTAGLAREFYE